MNASLKQDVMLSRVIAIVTCLSLVGVSLVPASLLPCCCKNRSMAQQGASGPTCPKCPPGTTASAMPCCAKMQSEAPACCTKNSLQQNCPLCRCMEQMQVVTLSSAPSDQLSVRVPVAAQIGETASVANPQSGTFHVFRHAGPPGDLTFLTTCTLRC